MTDKTEETVKITISAKIFDFIVNLSHEMQTQDNRSTAQPFAIISMYEKERMLDVDYGGDYKGIFEDERETFDDWAEFRGLVLEKVIDADDEKLTEAFKKFLDFTDFSDAEHEDCLEVLGIRVVQMKTEKEITEGDFQLFLTQKAYDEYYSWKHKKRPSLTSYGVCLNECSEMIELFSAIHAIADGYKYDPA
jgi:hypothetical protein